MRTCSAARPGPAWLAAAATAGLLTAALATARAQAPVPHAHAHAPGQARLLVSPIRQGDDTVAAGRQVYVEQCASCHGADGTGQTRRGRAMKVPPADLRSEIVHTLTEGDVFWTITHGIPQSGMPAFEQDLSDVERWQAVAYIRRLASGAATTRKAVAVAFRAMVGDAPLSCTAAFDAVGTTRSRLSVLDFRFYVHNVRLVNEAGGDVPVALDQDGRWQVDNLALLDFEDGTGTCANGSPEMHTAITGTVPAGKYTGVRFTLGLPFERNHQDPVLAPSPLNLSRMFWVWNAGYKFARFDFATTGQPQGWVLHLGSTNCTPNDTKLTVPTTCAHPNRVEVSIPGLDVERDAVIADVRSLLATSNVDSNTPDTAAGCMSGQGDPECGPLFQQLGLPFGTQPVGPQVFFRRGSTGVQPSAYAWNLPQGFPRPRVPADNPMTADKVELGRHLFYDTRLSVTGTFSCGTCHEQARAFTDGKARGVGATGEAHPRGPMSLVNVAYSPVLTWANPLVRDLERQALVPMLGDAPIELGLAGHEQELFARLRGVDVYRSLFARAFPGDASAISLANITRAIASFERSLISGRSPYDRYRFGGDQSAISAAARRGESLFFDERTECFHCHGGFNFTETVDYDTKDGPEIEFHNTGLYNVGGTGAFPADNTGVHGVTGKAADMGRFKAPTLRNIAVTAPYMHDGSLATLDEVIDHYASGGRTVPSGPYAGVGRDNPRKSSFVKGFTLTIDERRDLLEFLRSLTDETVLRDPRLADPWPSHASGASGAAR